MTFRMTTLGITTLSYQLSDIRNYGVQYNDNLYTECQYAELRVNNSQGKDIDSYQLSDIQNDNAKHNDTQ